MRKLVLGAAMLLFAQMGFGQAVSDQAVIPVSVTLNSILRLTVTAGGNIQFVVNTIDQYTNGINIVSDQYTTKYKVASSNDYVVTLAADAASLLGVEQGAAMDIAFIEYTASGGAVPGGALTLTDFNAPEDIATDPAGVIDLYEIAWRLTAGLLAEDLPADVYTVNVFLQVQPQP
jgi:hypothetical protein